MAKIYKRATIENEVKNTKTENYTRKRDVVANFRVSEAEKKLIDARLSVTGLSRSEFFIQSCMYQKILVKGNIKTFDNIHKKMKEIAEEISINHNLENMDIELVESWRVILEIFEKLYGRSEKDGTKKL